MNECYNAITKEITWQSKRKFQDNVKNKTYEEIDCKQLQYQKNFQEVIMTQFRESLSRN